MADAAAATADDKAPAVPAAPALPIKLLIIVVVAALAAGLGGAFVVVKMLGGKTEPAAAGEERKPEPQAKAEESIGRSRPPAPCSTWSPSSSISRTRPRSVI